MDKLVSLDRVIEQIKNIYNTQYSYIHENVSNAFWEFATKVVPQSLQFLDAREVERPEGTWIEYKDEDFSRGGGYECSNCHSKYSYDLFDLMCWHKVNYCPDCGSRNFEVEDEKI